MRLEERRLLEAVAGGVQALLVQQQTKNATFHMREIERARATLEALERDETAIVTAAYHSRPGPPQQALE